MPVKVITKEDLKENNKTLCKLMGSNIKKIVKEAVHEEFNKNLFYIKPSGKLTRE